MGLFEFMKDKGAELLGFAGAAREEKAKAIKANLGQLGLGSGVEVDINEQDLVTLTGNVATNEEKEKIILAVGNVAGVPGVSAEITVDNPTPEAQFYQVQSGDSLSKIAKSFYGDPMKYNEIFDANKPMLSDPEKIYPGQTLRIPSTIA